MSLRISDRFSIKSKKNSTLPPLGDSSVKRWLLVSLMSLILLVVSCQRGYCQIVTSNPGEYTILATGNALINNTVKSETKAETRDRRIAECDGGRVHQDGRMGTSV